MGEPGARRAVTALLALLALASALGWGWAVWRVRSPVPVQVAAVPSPPPPVLLGEAELARGLGAPAGGEAAPAQRLALLGVIAAGSGQGVALIAAEGEPPRPFRVGMQVLPGLVLQRLGPREAVLAESRSGPPSLRLELVDGPAPSAPPAGGLSAPEPGASATEPAAPVQPSPRGDQRGP